MSLYDQLKNRKPDFEERARQLSGTSVSNDTRFYYPERDKEGNGFAVIRFLLNKDHTKPPYVTVFKHKFTEDTGQTFFENCPTAIGQQCPVCSYNSELLGPYDRKMERAPANVQKEVRKRKRETKFISNILVVRDPTTPENEGKVFLFRFGKKLRVKMENALKPRFPDDPQFDPYDLFNGHDLQLKITKVDGQVNYDQSSWKDSPRAIADNADDFNAIMGQCYDLSEFLDPALYKSYEALETRFKRVMGMTMGAPTQSAPAPITAEMEVAEEDDDIPFDEGDVIDSPSGEMADAFNYFENMK